MLLQFIVNRRKDQLSYGSNSSIADWVSTQNDRRGQTSLYFISFVNKPETTVIEFQSVNKDVIGAFRSFVHK